MKRYNNLFEQVCDIENLRLASKKALKGKHYYKEVIEFNKNPEANLRKLLRLLTSGLYKTSEYETFTIYEPKERLIYKLPFYPDRIVHHAIMNILEPIWVNIFIHNTYSCIKNRGIHACVKDVKTALHTDPEHTKYCLKLDIRKFYPSIDHNVLKSIIRKKIKDKYLLLLLDEIIDSTDSVPIGNYLSQFFANLYLAYLDHDIIETFHDIHYFRYADDIVILSASTVQLHYILEFILSELSKLKLTIKDNWLVFPVESRGIDFVGYVFRHKYILLRKSIKLRMLNNLNEKNVSCYKGWLLYCNAIHLKEKILDTKGLYIESGFSKKVSLKRLNIKKIWVHSIFRGIVKFLYRHKTYRTKIDNRKLLYKLYYKFIWPRLK